MRSMSKWLPVIAGMVVIVAVLIAAGGDEHRPSAAGSPAVTVVELFTSQGCSSCPPADRLLSEIAGHQAGRVIPLAYHVDYWNRLGWTDPFSSAEWSRRQQAYAAAFHSEQVYTPQAVINGATEVVGSNSSAVDRAIGTASRESNSYSVTLAVHPQSDGVRLNVSTGARSPVTRPALQVLVAVAESGISTNVKRGENSGRELQNDHIVRRLVPVGTTRNGEKFEGSVLIKILPEWNRRNLEFVALLQDPQSMHIYGAAEATE